MGTSRDPPSDSDPDLWTLGQAADFLGISRQQVLGLIRQRALRYVQRGIRVRVHRQELERYQGKALD